jgi:hypothetical protein
LVVLSTNKRIKQTAHQNRQSSEYNTVGINVIIHLNVSSGGQLKIKIIKKNNNNSGGGGGGGGGGGSYLYFSLFCSPS